jgi:hypothetical protein
MGVTLLLFTCSNACQEISSGARSALPMGVAPEAIVEKYFFEYRLKYSVVHHTSSRNSLIITCLSNTRPSLQLEVAVTIFESSSPQGYNRKSFVYSLIYRFCTCRRHPSSFLYHLLYDVNEYVTLYECEPFYGQHCNFLNF